MQFTIRCETYCRLLCALKTFRADEERQYLKSIYVERYKGNVYAIASNAQIAAIELIGKEDGDFMWFNLTIDPALVAQAESEIPFGSTMTVIYNDMLKFASIKTTFGYNYPGNGSLQFGDDVKQELSYWRDWFPDVLPTKSKGNMCISADSIANLGDCSPSGKLIFPTFIDADKQPVMVRDYSDPNWIGLFMPNVFKDGKLIPVEAPTIPEWVK